MSNGGRRVKAERCANQRQPEPLSSIHAKSRSAATCTIVPRLFERYNIVSEGDLRTAAEQLRGLTGIKNGQSGIPSLSGEGETAKIAR